MQENLERERRISTCQGIQLLYRSRKAGIEEHDREIDRLSSEWHNELVPQKLEAMRDQNTSEIARINALQTENRRLVGFHKDNNRRKEQELNDLLNDYQFNECSVLTGSIN